MNSTELREKLNKALEKVEKTKKTIAKHYASAEKILKKIEDNGWTTNPYDWNDGNHHDQYWTACDYRGKISDAQGAEKKLKEAERVAQNWQEKLDRQIEHEQKMETEIPEVFKQVKRFLVEEWVKADLKERDRIKELRRTVGAEDWKKYRDMVSYSHEDTYTHTEEEFRRIEEREAEAWLLDLYNRVYAITGKVTDASGIRWGGKCLDGIIKGEAGTAIVETIGAGGYNIVRFHLRTLVKEFRG